MLAGLCRVILKTFFREIIIEGGENLEGARSAIITPNHPNALLDPMLLFFLSSPSPFRFVGKAPLFKIPVLGWVLRRLQAIPVVRHLDTEGEVDYTAFFAACVDALASGDSVVIFPEGRSLPQPYLDPLRTGAARLFLMARERGIDARIVPVGLNYEHGAIFRSSILISVAPPLDTNRFIASHATHPVAAVRDLTAEINRALAQHVFQAETYRDRELLLLLEQLYSENGEDDSWARRLMRLREFEAGLAKLRSNCTSEIGRLRHLLARYERLAIMVGIRDGERQERRPRSWLGRLVEAAGLVLASIGVVFNWLPYRLCAILVRLSKGDESMAATYKILFSLVLFPLTYAIEGTLVARWLGTAAAVLFVVLIVPLSYFTLLYFEWREELGAPPPTPSSWLRRKRSRRVMDQLARLRRQIIAEVDALAARPELRSDT